MYDCLLAQCYFVCILVGIKLSVPSELSGDTKNVKTEYRVDLFAAVLIIINALSALNMLITSIQQTKKLFEDGDYFQKFEAKCQKVMTRTTWMLRFQWLMTFLINAYFIAVIVMVIYIVVTNKHAENGEENGAFRGIPSRFSVLLGCACSMIWSSRSWGAKYYAYARKIRDGFKRED
jgi:hypothetical protein